MTKAWSMALLGVVGAALLAAAEQVKPGEDDLSLVKRAVASNAAVAGPAAPQEEAPSAPRPKARSHEPQWFKVRVVDKVTGKKKVTINMPLALVETLGDDLPVDWPCGEGARLRSTLKMSEVLSALEAGQDLVEVDDDESEVRVWVE
jgi:hypothetical protein